MPQPSFINLENSYPKERAPCDGAWANQCAIRMSIALNAELTLKVNKHTYSEPKCAHGHARGAESLANWLYKKIGPPKIFKSGADAKKSIATKTGIIFFKDCFIRTGEKIAAGDHIDVWNKGFAKTYDDPDNKAKKVWFWELT